MELIATMELEHMQTEAKYVLRLQQLTKLHLELQNTLTTQLQERHNDLLRILDLQQQVWSLSQELQATKQKATPPAPEPVLHQASPPIKSVLKPPGTAWSETEMEVVMKYAKKKIARKDILKLIRQELPHRSANSVEMAYYRYVKNN